MRRPKKTSLHAAISGTIPPYFSWAATCDATSLASNSWPERSLRKIATAVSSQEVSRASTVTSQLYGTRFACQTGQPTGLPCNLMREGRALLLYRFCLRRALLCVNHHAFQRVNGAQHLWILGLDDVDLVLWLNISCIAQRIQSALLFSDHADANI